jgi:acyl-CoA thioester hydrolase
MNNDAPRFELMIETTDRDIDVNGHVNNVVYLQWVQDVATAHWNAWATREQKESLTWVILRHEIDYKRAAFSGERLKLRTWIGEASGAKCNRFTEVVRERDSELLATAQTLWCLIDVKTQRPRRVDAELYNRFAKSHIGVGS